MILAISGCSNHADKIIKKTKKNLSADKALSYRVNDLNIMGSTSNDTLFNSWEIEAIFKYCPADTLIGHKFVLIKNGIHPDFRVPVQFTYSYNTLEYGRIIQAEVKQERTIIDKSNLKESVYEYAIRGQIPMIIKILNYDGFKLITKKDTIFDNCNCLQISVMDDNEIPYDLFINKQTCFPKFLRITENIKQPYISEYNYTDFEYLNSINDSVFLTKEIINSEVVKPLGIGDIFPGWKLNYLDGRNFDFEAILGNTKILYISMINCGSCQASLPIVKKLHEKYQNEDIQFLTFYPIDLKEKLDKYILAKEITYPLIYNSKKDTKQRFSIIDQLRFAYPKVLILNNINEITWINSGSSPNLEELIENAIKNSAHNKGS